jgi:hypothetical protein
LAERDDSLPRNDGGTSGMRGAKLSGLEGLQSDDLGMSGMQEAETTLRTLNNLDHKQMNCRNAPMLPLTVPAPVIKYSILHIHKVYFNSKDSSEM